MTTKLQTVATEPTVVLRVTMFGPLSVEVDGHVVDVAGAKNQALLSYLLFDPARPQVRSDLAGLLWPESTEERARQSLRASLYKIRKALDAAPSPALDGPKLSDTVLNIEKERVSIQPGVTVESDVGAFVDAVVSSEDHSHDSAEPCDPCQKELERAAALYRGELFAGISVADSVEFEEWLMLQRESLKNQALRVLDRLVHLHQAAGQHQSAHDRAFQILAIDRYDEFAHRAVITALGAQGHRAQALAHYEICRAAIVDDLGAELDAETVAVLTSLQHDDVAADLAGESVRNTPTPSEDQTVEQSVGVEPAAMPVQSVLPFHRNGSFVGRQEQLEALAELLVADEELVDTASAAVLSGIGGIGKTQLAIEFAYRYGHRFPGGVFWIRCNNPDAIVDEVAQLGGELGLGLYRTTELARDEQVSMVRRNWQMGERQLLIFDGCEAKEVVAEWLPLFGSVSTLVTSRKSSWPVELPVEEIPLQPLPPEASRELILRTASHLNDDEAVQVAEAVGNHPLALRLAAQFLVRLPSLSADDYVRQLEENSASLHESLEQPADSYSPTADASSLERTFALSYDQLTFDEPACVAARSVLALMLRHAPGRSINKAHLLELAASDPDDAQDLLWVEGGLQRLLDLGLVSTDGEAGIQMHRLVADYLRGHARIAPVPDAPRGTAWNRAATA